MRDAFDVWAKMPTAPRSEAEFASKRVDEKEREREKDS